MPDNVLRFLLEGVRDGRLTVDEVLPLLKEEPRPAVAPPMWPNSDTDSVATPDWIRNLNPYGTVKQPWEHGSWVTSSAVLSATITQSDDQLHETQPFWGATLAGEEDPFFDVEPSVVLSGAYAYPSQSAQHRHPVEA